MRKQHLTAMVLPSAISCHQTCVARAWDFPRGKPMVVCPAMNTAMWQHPFTRRHLDALRDLGVTVVDPVAKMLACGDTGVGALADLPAIVVAVREALHLNVVAPAAS
ncbi:unnamed protein product, partial [Phaeothamnion confervicola]